jgi:hypothetical protein
MDLVRCRVQEITTDAHRYLVSQAFFRYQKNVALGPRRERIDAAERGRRVRRLLVISVVSQLNSASHLRAEAEICERDGVLDGMMRRPFYFIE